MTKTSGMIKYTLKILDILHDVQMGVLWLDDNKMLNQYIDYYNNYANI